jgi:cold shock CspA family protein
MTEREPSPDQIRQATVHYFDAATGDGSVITVHGRVLPFSHDAWLPSRLRTLRLGQRVSVSVSGEGSTTKVVTLTLVTFPTGAGPAATG